jgi:uncharacterized protein (DUF608 family)
MNMDHLSCGCGPSGCTSSLDRRGFLKLSGLAMTGLAFSRLPAMAGPFTKEDFEKLVPADKKLRPEWVESLFARGARTKYRWPESQLIGMPVGGICTGQLYLGGDGTLWHWDIFNQVAGTGDGHYAHPVKPSSPLDQGFALKVSQGANAQVRPLAHTGWREIEFIGEYPMGFVEYRDPDAPVSVSLEAYSPFIPLNAEDSGLPATVMRFTVKNTSAQPVEAELAGWLENAVCLRSGEARDLLRRNRVVRRDAFSFVECSAEPAPEDRQVAKRPDILFDDFEREAYENWTAAGTAFGAGPIEKGKVPAYQGDLGMHGRYAVNSHSTAPDHDVGGKDAHTGTLTSKPFNLERNYISFLVGGGAHEGRTCVNLMIDDKVVLSATGANDNRMKPRIWDVRKWAGKAARIQVVDDEKGGWGNIGLDYIVFTDQTRRAAGPLADEPDYGTMGLALLRGRTENANPNAEPDRANPAVSESQALSGVFSQAPAAPDSMATRLFGEKLSGALTRKLRLAPGESAAVTFVVVWHFPNIKIDGLGKYEGRWYGKRFSSALAVAEHVAQHFDSLASQTRLWHDTWYDSTLPYWFLDRTFLNTCILATSTSYRFGNGRFWGWEGVGCCHGTCTHVWHYAQALARIFPELERGTRERVDLGLAFNPDSGVMGFRAEFDRGLAVDGQAGTLLRMYREHQMSPDDAFLKRNWPRIRKAFDPLLRLDGDKDGLLAGAQMNTLDQPWFGEIAWLSSLYLAALRAGERMATEMGDEAFAGQCREIVKNGRRNVDEKLFNGEYYFQQADPAHAKSVGSHDGCEIDQVFGQGWAWQVGLGRILDETKVKTALRSLWRYNFTPDVGPFRAANKPGRWYAMPGEGGLLMCSWPRGDGKRVSGGFDLYFNECMNGFEYQAAGHMVAEGMLLEGLAVTRTIHDRYHAARRNPWNEVECGDHYARSMASYGVFVAACGYEYHGPKGRLGFTPRLTPEDFRCAFTTAEGWGTFAQKAEGGKLKAAARIKWGKLRLKTLVLAASPNQKPAAVSASLAGKPLAATLAVTENRVEINFRDEALLHAGAVLEVVLS